MTTRTSQIDRELRKDIGRVYRLCCDGEMEKAISILNHCSDLDTKTLVNQKVENSPLLAAAARSGNTELVAYLLENGADINAMDDFVDCSAALVDAGKWNRIGVMRLLIANGAIAPQGPCLSDTIDNHNWSNEAKKLLRATSKKQALALIKQ